MKRKLLLGSVLFSSLAFAQVGINTSAPTSTLDITAKNATGTATNVDGVLIPRVDRQRAQSMTGVPTSTLVYINDVSTGTQIETTVNVDAVGHYFYNGSEWMKLNMSGGSPLSTQFFDWLKAGDAQPTAPGDNSVNIYHMGGHVGIGTNAPVGKLHLYNSTTGTEAGNDYIIDDESPISQVQGMVIRRSNAGANLAQNDFIGSISFSPKINGAFNYTGAGMAAIYRGNGTNALNALALRVNSNQEAMRLDENANVGIGTTTPGTRLDVNGAITNRETIVTVASNAATILENISQVQLTGAATAAVTITAPAAPNAGQRLVVFNNTTGGFGATLNSITVPNGKALEFVYSNSGWRSTDGGAVAAAGSPVNIYTADGTISSNRTVTQGANTLAFTSTATNAFSVDGSTFSVDAANDRIGIGTAAPTAKLQIASGTAGVSGLKFSNINNVTPATGNTAGLGVDAAGNVVVQSSLTTSFKSFSIDANVAANSLITLGNLEFRYPTTTCSSTPTFVQIRSSSGANNVGIMHAMYRTAQSGATFVSTVPLTATSTFSDVTSLPMDCVQDGHVQFNFFSYTDRTFYRVSVNIADGDSQGFGALGYIFVELQR